MGHGSAEEQLPLPESDNRQARPDPRPAILIVDDTPANIQAFSSVLEGDGYVIVTASSGQQALKLVLNREFAVILLDVRMPGMDGIETAAFLRGGRGRFTPIVFVSAHENTPMEVERGYLVGAIDYLFSPVDSDVLRRKVSALVDFYSRNAEYKKRADSLFQANKTMMRTIDALQQTVSELRGHAPNRSDTTASQ